MKKFNKDKNYRFLYNSVEKKKFLLEYLIFNLSLNPYKRFLYSYIYYNKPFRKKFLKSKI